MTRKKITGFGVGTPLASASLSWEYVDADHEHAPGLDERCLVLPGGQLPKIGQVGDPILLGVHPSSSIQGDIPVPGGGPLLERVPAYVPRDADDELRQRVAIGGFVLVVGDSSAGKSRAAYEAITALPDHALIVPQNRDSVAMAISKAASTRRCVLWLDDLENYLGTGGLTRAGIARLLGGKRCHRVIVATLRAAEEALLTGEAAGPEGGRQTCRDARDVLELAHRIPLPRIFSQSEQERAIAQAWDPRIAEALTNADIYGVAEYLAAGPELLRDWEDAWSSNTDPRAPSHPRGAALIAAAIDIRRGGYASPLPRSMLEEVHDHYLRERGGSRLRPEPLAEAWMWATKARRATTALLQVVGDQHIQVFDYLLDTMQRRGNPGDHVPDGILEVALAVSAPVDAENIASTAYYHGRYHLAEAAWLRAYSAQSEALGPEHPNALAARGAHANVLRELGRDTEAESEHRAIADIAARVFGPEHPLVLESRNGRAFAMIRLGRFQEAEEELRAVRDVSSRALGPEHDVTLTSRHLRAIALDHLGRLAEAEAENRFVLGAWIRDSGPEDASTLYSRGNLASVLYDAGKFEEAESEARAVLDIRTRVLGPEHPDTLHSRTFRAYVLRELGRDTEAESEHRAIADIAARVFGPEHPDALAARGAHANVLRELGRDTEAESEHRAIADIAARVFGPEHPLVLESRNGRAFAMIRLGRFQEAEEELRAVRDVSSRALGPEHDVTLTSRHLRAIALDHLGRLAEAEAENRFVLGAWTRDSGPEDASTLYSRGNLASVLYDAGKFEEAESEARAVLDIRTRIFGAEHKDTVWIRSLLDRIEGSR